MSFKSKIRNAKSLQSFLWWYKQMSIDLKFTKAIGHATDDKSWMRKQILFFIPTVVAGYIYTLFGKSKCIKINEKDKKKTFKHDLAIVAIVKNEGLNLPEWLCYHINLGFSKFLIYDNGSDDNIKDVLAPYIKDGIVEHIWYPGKDMQWRAYQDSLVRLRDDCRYIAYIDLDEFLVPKEGKTVLEIVQTLIDQHPYAGGVCMKWFNFGTSGHIERPKGLVIENYTNRAVEGFIPCIKTIGNPRLMRSFVNPHVPIYEYGTFNINDQGCKNRETRDNKGVSSLIHINHYFTKSEEEAKAKMMKGRADMLDVKRSWEEFQQRNRNDVHDEAACRFIDAVKKEMEKRVY